MRPAFHRRRAEDGSIGVDRFTEFGKVLIFALMIGAAVALIMRYLAPALRPIALVILGVVAIAVWQYLRKRFGRSR